MAGVRQPLELIAEYLDEALWLADVRADRLLYVSPGFERVWGRPVGALRGTEDFFACIHGDDRERVRELARAASREGCDVEFRIVHPDGQVRWVRHRSIPIAGPDGEVATCVGITRDIHEARCEQIACRGAEQRLDALGGSAYEVLTELDSRGQVVWTSRPDHAAFRRPMDPPSPRPDLVHPDDREAVMETLSRAIREEHQASISFRIRDADDQLIWLETTAIPFRTDEGERHALFVSRDVSSDRNLLEKVRDSEEHFRQIAECAHDLITEYDGNGDLLYANPQTLIATGYTFEECRRLSPQDYLHPDDVADLMRTVEKVTPDGDPLFLIVRARRKDGSWRWYETNVHAHRMSNGSVRMVVISRDVTARKNAEDRLRESERRYRQLVEYSPEGIIVHADGRILYTNEAAARLMGAEDRDQLVGMPVVDFVDPASLEHMARHVRPRDGVEGRTLDTEYRIRRLDGEIRDVIGSGSMITYAGRSVVQTVMRDITDRKRAEQDHQRLQMQLQEARKLESLGVLAGGIAHDFNNLLAVILGNARHALRHLDDATDAREALADTVGAAESAARLTTQLLAYAGRRAPEVRPIDLSEHVRSLVGLLEAAVPKKVTLRFELAEELPRVRADVVQIEQVLMNLVLNAAEAIGDAEGVIAIRTARVRASREEVREWTGASDLDAGDYVRLEVNDSGCGIDEEAQRRIFDPFFTTKPGGHGLGLSAVLGLVRGHGGGLAIDSLPGRGTTIRVHLPVLALATGPGPEVERTPTAAPHLRLLVADDEPAVRRMLRRVLQAEGCEVIEASDGLEAVEIYRARADEIDAVVLDLHMPRADGEEALRELRALRPDLPVLLSSGDDQSQIAHRFADDPHTRFIGKPFAVYELLALLEPGRADRDGAD